MTYMFVGQLIKMIEMWGNVDIMIECFTPVGVQVIACIKSINGMLNCHKVKYSIQLLNFEQFLKKKTATKSRAYPISNYQWTNYYLCVSASRKSFFPLGLQMKKLIDHIEKDWNTLKNEQDIHILQQFANDGRIMTLTYASVYNTESYMHVNNANFIFNKCTFNQRLVIISSKNCLFIMYSIFIRITHDISCRTNDAFDLGRIVASKRQSRTKIFVSYRILRWFRYVLLLDRIAHLFRHNINDMDYCVFWYYVRHLRPTCLWFTSHCKASIFNKRFLAFDFVVTFYSLQKLYCSWKSIAAG